jgi:hypothetical protein
MKQNVAHHSAEVQVHYNLSADLNGLKILIAHFISDKSVTLMASFQSSLFILHERVPWSVCPWPTVDRSTGLHSGKWTLHNSCSLECNDHQVVS